MKSRRQEQSSSDKVGQITTELNRLFQQQIELTKWEAFVGLTPTELEEYDRVVERIRQLYVDLGKLNSRQGKAG
jgi:hypothetical protein